MENNKHDAGSYDCSSYQREIYDGNALYDAFLKSKKQSNWKASVQSFEMDYLLGLATIQRELMDHTYKLHPTHDFVMNERGKLRPITGEVIQDRIVKHSLCDEVLNPTLFNYIIYDNGASIENRGISFSRERLVTHLRKYYMQNGSNEGFVLRIDFSKYYDNMRHDILIGLIEKYIHDPDVLWLLKEIVNHSRVDVSYMDDDEYENCMNTLFSSLTYREEIDKSLLTGEKYMNKHLNIGDQLSQTAGIVYPMQIDNYIKIVKSVKFYGRYMDDSYVIHNDIGFLEQLLSEVINIANSLGITVNQKKTRIYDVSKPWSFLQVQYFLTDTGKVVQKINPDRLTTMRRKMKKLAPRMPITEFCNWYRSWFKGNYKLMSKDQRNMMDGLRDELLQYCPPDPEPLPPPTFEVPPYY